MLHLQPPGAMRPSWSVASVTIPIKGGVDVIGIVSRIASDLGLSPDSKDSSRWWILLSERDRLVVSVTKEVGGYWTVTLADWPTTKRSEQSLKAEAMIREALKKPNHGAATNRRPAGESDSSGNLSAIGATDRAFPAADAELGR